jgi:hypothetical protein
VQDFSKIMADRQRRPDPAHEGAAPSECSDESDAKSTEKRPRDVLWVGGNTAAGGRRVLRQRDNQIEVGEVRTMRDGEPIHGSVLQLRPRPEHDRLFDVEVLAEPSPRAGHAGPARVASAAYRRGWEAIFAASSSEEMEARLDALTELAAVEAEDATDEASSAMAARLARWPHTPDGDEGNGLN